MTGKEIREFFRDVFGSRLVAQLSEDLLRLRSDFEQRLQDKDVAIAQLREEKGMLMAKITTYETVIMPRTSRAGAEVIAYQKPSKPSFEFLDIGRTKTRWEAEQERHNAQMAKELKEEEEKKSQSLAAQG